MWRMSQTWSVKAIDKVEIFVCEGLGAVVREG